MPKRIPIKAVKEFARSYGLAHVIVLAHEDGRDHVVTYGETVEQCSEAADFGNRLKDLLGWPESLSAQPPRVRRLQVENKRLQERTEMLEKALRFYADESIHDYQPDSSGADSKAESDRGSKARAALEEARTSK